MATRGGVARSTLVCAPGARQSTGSPARPPWPPSPSGHLPTRLAALLLLNLPVWAPRSANASWLSR
eukprot:8135564-Alexandrium_andersonii.AAC.1